MTVQQLIDDLNEVEDKNLLVKFYGKSLDGSTQKYVNIDEIAVGRFVEIISMENDGRTQ